MVKNKLKNSRFFLECLLLVNFFVFILFNIYSERITKVCLVTGIILYILIKINQIRKKEFHYIIPQTSLNKPTSIFLLICIVSIIFSYDFYNSQKEFFNRIIPYFVSFYMGTFLAQRKKWVKYLIYLMLAGAAVLGAGVIFKFIEVGKFIRIESIWGARSTTYFLCSLPFFACFAIFHPSKKIKIISTLGSCLVFIGFLFTYYRSAWIASFLSFGGIFLLFKKSRKFSFWIIAFLATIILVFPVFRKRIVSKETLNPTAWGDRVYLWSSAANIFSDYPITGIGLGGFERYAYEYENGKPKKKKRHPYSHNVYLDVLAEIGILGLISFLWIWIVFFKQIYKKIKNNFNFYDLAFMIVVSSFLIFNLTESIMLTGVGTTFFFWFLFGLGNGSLKNA